MIRSFYFIIAVLMLVGCAKNNDVQEFRWKVLETPTTNELTGIDFSSNHFGVACGSFGTLLKTDDAGKNWQNLDAGVGYSFRSVFVLNNNEFYTARNGLYKTVNGGESFNETGDLSGFGAAISDIHFFSSQEGIICKGATIYRTIDSGNHWTAVYPFEGYATMLEVTDHKTIYLAGGRTYDSIKDGEMHKSIDNGETWGILNLPEEMDNSEITAIDFLDNHTGYVSTFENKLFKTLDGGGTWIRIAELSFGRITDILYLNENHGFLIRENYIYSTEDGGLHWHEEYQAESTVFFTSIAAAPNGTLYVAGLDGIVVQSTEFLNE